MTMPGFRTACVAGVIVLSSIAYAGSLEYPALGNLDLEEGTLEVWLTPMVELRPDIPVGGYQGAFGLFSMVIPEHFAMSCGWASKGPTSHGFHVSMDAVGRPKALLSVPTQDTQWAEGQLHHFAFTWKGHDMRVYTDGVLAGSRNQAIAFSGPLAGQTLFVGGGKGRDSRMIVHAIRTSCIARTPEMLSDAEPLLDIYTLMLDRFDHSGDVAEGHTTAELIAGLTGEGGAAVSGAYHFVEGSLPGLALYPAS